MTDDDHAQLLQRAETAMFQAELAASHLREAFYVDAKDALIQVEMRAPGRGAWLMACLNARMGNPPLARKWLERAHAANALPVRSVLVTSAYMKDLHGEAWFQEILARIE